MENHWRHTKRLVSNPGSLYSLMMHFFQSNICTPYSNENNLSTSDSLLSKPPRWHFSATKLQRSPYFKWLVVNQQKSATRFLPKETREKNSITSKTLHSENDGWDNSFIFIMVKRVLCPFSWNKRLQLRQFNRLVTVPQGFRFVCTAILDNNFIFNSLFISFH